MWIYMKEAARATHMEHFSELVVSQLDNGRFCLSLVQNYTGITEAVALPLKDYEDEKEAQFYLSDIMSAVSNDCRVYRL